MTIENNDRLLVNRGSTSHQIKYEKIKQDIAASVSDSVDDAPDDGKQYGRQNSVWTEIVHPTPYTDANVDAHLNTNLANGGQILSWDGSDYKWVADQTGSGGGGGGSSDASLISYQYPNGTSRSVESRLTDYVSIKDFGAVPDTECSAAIQAALDTGRAVYIPAGVYFLDSTLTFTGQNVTIIGEGEQTSALQFRHTGDGIVVNLVGGFNLNQLRIDGVKILNTTASVAGTAIIVSAVEGGDAYNYVDINNVQIRENWAKGIEFNSTSQIKINNLVAYLNKSTSILHLKGSCLDSSFENMNLGVGSLGLNNVIGILIDNSTGYAGNEGVRVTNSTFLKCNIGIRYDGGLFEPHLVVSDCHFNCITNALSLKNVGQSFIHDNLFFAWLGTDLSAIKDSSIIYVEGNRGGEHTSIANNVFHAKGRNNVQNIGIEWNAPTTGDSISNISDNIFMQGLNYGIRVTADTDGLVCQDNVFDPGMAGDIQISATVGNASDTTLVDKNNSVIQTIRNKGTNGKSVSLRLQNNDKNFYISQNADNNSALTFEDALTFNTDVGNNQYVQCMQCTGAGNVEFPNGLVLIAGDGSKWKLSVSSGGSLSTARV